MSIFFADKKRITLRIKKRAKRASVAMHQDYLEDESKKESESRPPALSISEDQEEAYVHPNI